VSVHPGAIALMQINGRVQLPSPHMPKPRVVAHGRGIGMDPFRRSNRLGERHIHYQATAEFEGASRLVTGERCDTLSTMVSRPQLPRSNPDWQVHRRLERR